MMRIETHLMDDGVIATSDGQSWLVSRGEKFLGRLQLQQPDLSLPVFMLGLVVGALGGLILK